MPIFPQKQTFIMGEDSTNFYNLTAIVGDTNNGKSDKLLTVLIDIL